MEANRISAEISEIRRQNVRSVLRKLATGICVILMVGVVIYSLLFLAMVIM